MKQLICIVLFFFYLVMPAVSARTETGQPPSGDDPAGTSPLITEEEQQKLKQDAEGLSEEFRTLFKDLTKTTKKATHLLVDRIGQWLERHYSEQSEANRARIREFLKELKERCNTAKEMSMETLLELLDDLNRFIDSLDKETPPAGGNHERQEQLAI